MESLRTRNEKLAAEVSRLKIENKTLKDKVNKLLSRVLNIPEIECKNKSVQTNFVDISSGRPNLQLKSSTPINLSHGTIRDDTSRNPFRYSPPLYNLYDVSLFSQFSPPRQSLSPGGSHLVSPQSKDKVLLGEFVESKVPSSSDIQNSNDLYAIVQHLQTPVRSLFQEDYIDSGTKVIGKSDADNTKAAKYVGTPIHAPPSARLPRSVSKVKSYKEPSLSVKVRKGFKFFSFED